VIIAQGGSYAGWSLYLKDGVPHYCHNFVSLGRYTVGGESAIPAGEHQLRLELAYDGGGLAKGGTATLYVGGDKIGEGRIEQTVPLIFASDETVDVGCDKGRPITDDYAAGDHAFTGRINWVQLDLDGSPRGRRLSDQPRGAIPRRFRAPVIHAGRAVGHGQPRRRRGSATSRRLEVSDRTRHRSS
jgi:hypothetical protein